MKTFADKVRDIVRRIPKGETMTYKEVAKKAGNERAARAVGAIMRTNFDESIPCHRVVASDGTMRGYNRGGVDRKRQILTAEGALCATILSGEPQGLCGSRAGRLRQR